MRKNDNDKNTAPEEIAKSLRVCFKLNNGCSGCIYDCNPDYSDIEVDCRTDLAKAAADLIEAQAARLGELEADLAKLREENRWVSVEDRLPEDNG